MIFRRLKVAPVPAVAAVNDPLARVAASPAGAACTALAESTVPKAAAAPRPCRERKPRKFFQRAIGAFPRGVFGKPEFFPDVGKRLILEIAHQDGGAVRFVQFVHHLVEHGAEFFPVQAG